MDIEQKSLHVIRSLESSATLASVSFRGRQGGTGVGSTPGTSLEASPTDRVEKLLKKYSVPKVGPSDSASTSYTSLPEAPPPAPHHQNKLVLVELELWAALSDQLRAAGYKGVGFEQKRTETDYLCLSVPSSTVARLTISCLLKELQQKDETINSLRQQLSNTSTASSGDPSLVRTAQEGHVITELRSQLARAEYENARLKVDGQNKPHLEELSTCQKKVKDLEMQLLHSKVSQSKLSNDHSQLLQCQQQIKDICSVILVSKGVEIIPTLKDMKAKLASHKSLEKQFTALLELVYHHSNPQLSRKWARPIPPHPSGHELWCEVTWSHVIMTLQEWAYHLQGLKELQHVMGKVGQQLEQHCVRESSSTDLTTRHTPADHRAGVLGEEGDKVLWFSCQEMASFLRRWLLKKANMKSVSYQIILTMVQHFQHLFQLSSLEGVYPTMSVLSQQIEEHRNVLNRLRGMLNLGENCSSHKLVSTIEFVVLKENSQFMHKVGRLFGPKMDIDRVVDKLKLCDDFFPSFHALVLEIQMFLGVNNLSEIIPALYKLSPKM